MAGRRFVHAAKLLQASRDVVHEHIALRSQQYDVYSRTSTLAKAVKSQTDRITLTISAAAALCKRFGETTPLYTKAAPPQSAEGSSKDTSRVYDPYKNLPIDRENQHSHNKPRCEQSQTTLIHESHTDEGLKIAQRQGTKDRLPDGTIPPTSDSIRRNQEGKIIPASSIFGLSDSEAPLQQSVSHHPSPKFLQDQKLRPGHEADNLSSTQSENNLLVNCAVDASSPAQTGPQKIESRSADHGRSYPEHILLGKNTPDSLQSNDRVPEGIDTDVFRSRRVARMLGTDRTSRKEHIDSSRAIGAPNHRAGMIADRKPDVGAFQMPHGAAQDSSVQTSVTAQESKAVDPNNTCIKDGIELNSRVATGVNVPLDDSKYALRESRVPSSRVGRFWQYAGLGTSMAFGAVSEGFRRVTGNAAASPGSIILSPNNMEILVSRLSRMRGAALKLGQMISFQDVKLLPPAIHDVLQRVQDSADYMPAAQRNQVLASNLGTDWRDLFVSFDEIPIAAASIGQVHRATLRSTHQPVAVKVQYPGVANSIDSDLSNLSLLLTASRLLPKGLFLDRTIANARTELGWECDYEREAECQNRFRRLLEDDRDVFTVPKIFAEASGKEVLTAEFMFGSGVTKSRTLTQDQRDWIGTQILRLCLREIVEFRFMQTDPNWTNFMYNVRVNKIELLDFGACRDYPPEFIDPYINVLIAASKGDRHSIRALSIELGYLTGDESPTMLEAHLQSILTLAEPFSISGPAIYDFRDQTITNRVRDLIPIMVKERLAPPPEETYSLHRKLSGAFLLCARLGSRVPCRDLFDKAINTVRS